MTREICFVGCLNRPTPYFKAARGTGIAVVSFDDGSGAITLLSDFTGVDNPTYLSVDPARGLVFATSEVAEWNEGDVTALHYDAAAHRLVYGKKQPTLGSIAAYSSPDRTGRFVLVANYGMGDADQQPGQAVAVFPILNGASLGPAVSSVVHDGHGPHAERQERPHPHSVVPSPDNRFMIVPDLGTDQLVTYRFDASSGALARARSLALPPGCGPRHLVFHPAGTLAFVVAELTSRLISLRFSPETGAFSILDDVPSVPGGAATGNYAADLHLSPDGRFLYASNRGHDSIVIAAVDSVGGTLSVRGWQPSGGATPRNFALSPSGRHLLVANQDGDSIEVFARNAETGLLSGTPHRLAIGSPMCIAFG